MTLDVYFRFPISFCAFFPQNTFHIWIFIYTRGAEKRDERQWNVYSFLFFTFNHPIKINDCFDRISVVNSLIIDRSIQFWLLSNNDETWAEIVNTIWNRHWRFPFRVKIHSIVSESILFFGCGDITLKKKTQNKYLNCAFFPVWNLLHSITIYHFDGYNIHSLIKWQKTVEVNIIKIASLFHGPIFVYCCCSIIIESASRIQVDEYLTERGSESEQEAGADYTLQILDVVLKSEHSLNNQQVIAKN